MPVEDDTSDSLSDFDIDLPQTNLIWSPKNWLQLLHPFVSIIDCNKLSLKECKKTVFLPRKRSAQRIIKLLRYFHSVISCQRNSVLETLSRLYMYYSMFYLNHHVAQDVRRWRTSLLSEKLRQTTLSLSFFSFFDCHDWRRRRRRREDQLILSSVVHHRGLYLSIRFRINGQAIVWRPIITSKMSEELSPEEVRTPLFVSSHSFFLWVAATVTS